MQMKELLAREACIIDWLLEMKGEIREKIIANPMDFVTPLGGGCYSVPLSLLNKTILAAEYYSPTCQADIVSQALLPVKTAHDFVDKISEMVRTQSVRIGQTTHRLNPKTVEVLQDVLEGRF